jgi:hypothetical protein
MGRELSGKNQAADQGRILPLPDEGVLARLFFEMSTLFVA